MPKPLHHGDVLLVPFPFADLSGQKVRPAVVVSADPQGPELILAFITSVLSNRSPRGAEVVLLRPMRSAERPASRPSTLRPRTPCQLSINRNCPRNVVPRISSSAKLP